MAPCSPQPWRSCSPWLSRAGSVSWGRVLSQSITSWHLRTPSSGTGGAPVQPHQGLNQPRLPRGTRCWQVLFWVLCRGLCQLFLPAHPCTAAVSPFIATLPGAESRYGGAQHSGGNHWLCCCCYLGHSPGPSTCGTQRGFPGHRVPPRPCLPWGFMEERVQPCHQHLVFPSDVIRAGAWVRFVPALIGPLISPAGKMGVPEISQLKSVILATALPPPVAMWCFILLLLVPSGPWLWPDG